MTLIVGEHILPINACHALLAGYPLYSEANYFADQAGVFEIISTSDLHHKQAMRQVEM